MRRLSVLLLCASLAALAPAHLPTANAADPMFGRLLKDRGLNDRPIAGVTVRLRAVAGSGPGAIIDTDTTGRTGLYSLDAGPSPDDEYYVQVMAGSNRGGYVGGTSNWVQPTAATARTYGPHQHMQPIILADPEYIAGALLDSVTHERVVGVKVTARSATDITQVEGRFITSDGGRFRIRGLECEQGCYLMFDGGSNYETGFRACNRAVVAASGDACPSPIGYIGRVLIDPS